MRSDGDDNKPEGQSKAELLSWRGNLARIALYVNEMSKIEFRGLNQVRYKASELELS